MALEDIEAIPGGARLKVVVLLSSGLHARPAAKLFRAAQRYTSTVRIRTESGEADAKSILDILALALARGTECEIEAVGPDAREAVATVAMYLTTDQDS